LFAYVEFNIVLALQSEGFHPEKSRVNANALADFIRAPLTGDLLEVFLAFSCHYLLC
jgi:hypothetical protein